jgi:serine/threonine-protein kinase
MDWEAFYSRFREPDFIPGYEIQNRLGGGAFGEVYKARKHSIGKAYAIKFLKIDDEAQKDAVERELEQVRHFAVIDHPNLVTIEDLGTALGVPYLVMGYAGEDTLARRLKQGRLEPQAALSFFVQACRGVVALHDRRLVHFDLKPSNVFLKGDIARVGDYGLSKMMADGRLTLSFGRGTPQYMAPEMMRNRADHRADIYSLGVILYESFARKLPFESLVPGTFPMRESDTAPLFPPDFPAGLRAVVERCLRLAPDDRYADVGEVLADLGQTARPGDSVRWNGLENVAATHAGTRGPSSRQGGDGGGSEARHTARELTRGFVEVVRGVRDGLVTKRATEKTPPDPTHGSPPTPPRASTPTPTRTTAPSSTTATTATTGEARAPTPVPSARSDAGAPPASDGRGQDGEAREILTLHGLSETGDEKPLTPFPMTPATAGMTPARALTIPVPPPVQGGWRGTLFSTVALAVEVLLALFRGIVDVVGPVVTRGGSRAGAASKSVLRTTGRILVGTIRLVLFVLLLVGLGGLTVLVIYVLTHPD